MFHVLCLMFHDKYMLINELLKIAVEEQASDLHLLTNLPPVIRIDGDLKYIEGRKAIAKKEMEQMVFPMISEQDKEKFYTEKSLA